jgi:hypothetical protein
MKGPAELFGRALILFLVVLVVSGAVFHSPFLALGSDGTLSRIEEADTAVQEAFTVVLEAERAGANVSGLMVRLNEAGGLLADSRMAYRNGNFTEAESKATDAILVAQNVTVDGTGLKASALADAQTNLQVTLVLSVVGATAFAVGVVLAWDIFKRAYLRRLGKMKPEVASDVEA